MLRKTVKELGFHSLIYMLGGVASSIASIILLPVYTRFLSPADYGILEIIDNMRAQLRVLLVAGLTTATAKFYKKADSEDGQKEVFGTSFWFLLISCSIWLSGLFLFDESVAQFLLRSPDLVIFINLGTILLFIQIMLAAGNSYLVIQKRSQLYLVASLGKLGLNIGMNLYFIVTLRLGAKGMLYGEIVSSGTIGVLLIANLIRQNGLPFNRALLGRMLKFGFPFVPNVFSAALMHGADRSLLRPRWPSVSAIGIYGVGYRFPFMLNSLILSSFARIWNASVMYEVAKQENYQRTYAKIATYFMTIYVVCQYMLVVMAPTLIRILAAPDYFESWRIVQIIGLGMCFYALHNFFIVGAFIKSKTWYLPFSPLISAIVNIILNWYFLPRYGYMAAAWNTVITYLLFSTIGFLIFRKIYPIPFEFHRLVFLFSTGIILVLINNVLSFPNFVLEGAKQVVFAVLFPLILIFGPYLDQDEKESLQKELYKISPNLALLYLRIQAQWTKMKP